jgi:autotransporter passenger strand-loop-strand repeat protein
MTTTNIFARQTSSGPLLSIRDPLNASDGGLEDIAGLSVTTTVGSGGPEIVLAGGSASSALVNTGGALLVLPNGSAVTPVRAGGSVVSTGIALEQSEGGALRARKAPPSAPEKSNLSWQAALPVQPR